MNTSTQNLKQGGQAYETFQETNDMGWMVRIMRLMLCYYYSIDLSSIRIPQNCMGQSEGN